MQPSELWVCVQVREPTLAVGLPGAVCKAAKSPHLWLWSVSYGWFPAWLVMKPIRSEQPYLFFRACPLLCGWDKAQGPEEGGGWGSS